MAGIYARVDQERGVHKAPANEPVRGAWICRTWSRRNEQESLNPAGINVIRSFERQTSGSGARARSAATRTASTKYINVRRLMNFLRESIEEGTQFVGLRAERPAACGSGSSAPSAGS